MRVVFAGTPEFAARALDALIRAGHEIPLVLTQPDRPAGRGMKPRMSPVKELALAHGLPVAQPDNLKTAEARQPIVDARADVMVVAAYGLILPQAALDIPKLGCVNIHASLLPRWRGAAPIQRAIGAGDAETGITLMQMDKGLDTGAMLAVERLAIGADEDAGQLHDRLAGLGAEAIVRLLPELANVVPVPQDEARACYASKIAKDEARLVWDLPAAQLHRHIRAFNPFPGAGASLEGEPLKVWRAALASGHGRPGEVLEASAGGILVACGDGALNLLEIQKAGGKRLPVVAFLAGHPVRPGACLG